jgi:hypothetical protein
LAASAFRAVLILARALPFGQWSLAPDQNSAELPGQNLDSSTCFGIPAQKLVLGHVRYIVGGESVQVWGFSLYSQSDFYVMFGRALFLGSG